MLIKEWVRSKEREREEWINEWNERDMEVGIEE